MNKAFIIVLKKNIEKSKMWANEQYVTICFFVRIFLFLLEILQKCQKYAYIIKVTVFEQVYFFYLKEEFYVSEHDWF